MLRTDMKLSDAILKGCKLRPKQGFGKLFPDDSSACALGAALIGAGYVGPVSRGMEFEEVYEIFPILEEISPFDTGRTLGNSIWKMNDLENKSREEIAEILKTCGL